MAGDVSTLIERLTQALPSLRLVLRPEFGSSHPGYRQNLRQELALLTGEPGSLDLASPPTLAHGFVSISHCPSLGGFVLAPERVGLDIEVTSRVEQKIATRIHHPDDEPIAFPSALWTAKEATYKALGPRQPAVFTEIAIQSWRFLKPDHLTFTSQSGHGVVLVESPWTVAIFMVVS